MKKIFSTLASRHALRDMIQQQVIGRFDNDITDDPLPHVMWGLLNDIDTLENELNRLRAPLAHWGKERSLSGDSHIPAVGEDGLMGLDPEAKAHNAAAELADALYAEEEKA